MWTEKIYVCNTVISIVAHKIVSNQIMKQTVSLSHLQRRLNKLRTLNVIEIENGCLPPPPSPSSSNNTNKMGAQGKLSPVKRTQHCWMLPVASVCTPCCMMLYVFGTCCANFETGETFEPKTPNISFVPWFPKRSVTMSDPFAQLYKQWWGHARALYIASLEFSKSYGLYPSNADALQVPTLLGVGAFVYTKL